MNTPQLLTDMANLMLLLAPSASLVCLVLAGIGLRREAGGVSFVIGGGFTKWMFWAVLARSADLVQRLRSERTARAQRHRLFVAIELSERRFEFCSELCSSGGCCRGSMGPSFGVRPVCCRTTPCHGQAARNPVNQLMT